MLRWKTNAVRLHAASQLDEVQRRMNEFMRHENAPAELETNEEAAAPEADASDAGSQDSANAPTLVMGEGSP